LEGYVQFQYRVFPQEIEACDEKVLDSDRCRCPLGVCCQVDVLGSSLVGADDEFSIQPDGRGKAIKDWVVCCAWGKVRYGKDVGFCNEDDIEGFASF